MPPYPRFLRLFTTTLLLSLIIHLPIETSLKMNAAIAQPASSEDQKAEAERLLEQGNQQFAHSEYQEALQSWQQALDIYREIGDRQEEANALNNIGNTYRHLGEYPKALELYEQSLTIAREVGDRQGEANSLANLGNVYTSLGEHSRAIEFYNQALAIFQKMNDRAGNAAALYNLGHVYQMLGEYSRAIELSEQALTIFQETGDHNNDAISLNNLGSIHFNLGEYPKAIEFHEQALTIFQSIGERDGEAAALAYLGNAYFRLGEYPKAVGFYEQSLVIFQNIGNRSGEAHTLMFFGNVYFRLGDYPQAIKFYERSLAIFRDIGERDGETTTLANLGITNSSRGEYSKAIEFYEQSLVLSQKIGNRNGEAFALMQLGFVHNSLGQYSEAIEFSEQSLTLYRNIGDRHGEASSLGSIGIAYGNLGEYSKAIEFYEQSLAFFQNTGDRNNEAAVLVNLGNVYRRLEEYSKAVGFYEQSLMIFQDIGDRSNEATALMNLGISYFSLGKHPQAIEFYEQSLPLFREVGDREGEGQTLANLGNLLADQNQPEAAIVFLKQSVNVIEAIRQDNWRLSQELQQSYTNTVADAYRLLSDLLLAQGKILEAQQVLELLKLQELRDFTGVRAKVTANGIELTPAEQAVITQHNTLIAFGQQVNQCQRTQCSQLNALLDQRDQLTQQFNQTLQTFEAEIRARLAQDRAALDTQDFNRSAREIVEAQPGTVMIYAVVLDDKLWLLWATAGGVVNSVEVPVTRQKLGETVLQFRQLLSTPNSDITQVQATAKQLHDWLIAPIAPELEKNQIQHLVFSLDRVTRYIPMAALFDGQHYLIENYTVSTVLSADLTNVSEHLPPGTDQTSVLALGLSNAVPPDFPALPNVPAELNAIVRSSDDPQGIYSGLKFLNGQFDDRTLRNNLSGHQIVHIATHGVFVPGQQDQSYLVLGNGQRMSISSIQELQDLGDVKLVVLSACQTALGEPDQDGLEIAGIAYYFLNGGANTVMASLWAVSDASTQQLMQHLYTNLSRSTAQAPITRAEALQQAQLNLLHGSTNATETADRSIVGVRPAPGAAPADAASSGLSHPYYWAPFILIGNGL